ncbi:MAG: hypothetical protein MUC88_00840 [Planctomycetes bacterium]|jgi:hypothetical protein|nr:hypothetical protein [Planctomycetota bacterium]
MPRTTEFFARLSQVLGGSGKRSLPMVLVSIPRAIGKLRLPLPPVARALS